MGRPAVNMGFRIVDINGWRGRTGSEGVDRVVPYVFIHNVSTFAHYFYVPCLGSVLKRTREESDTGKRLN